MSDEPPKHRYPDFLCIGAQKAGTTWLDKNLRRHPMVSLPPIKETQYFNHLYLPQSRNWTSRHRAERGHKLMPRYLERTPPEEWDYRYISVLADMVTGPVCDDWYGRIFALARADQVCGEFAPDYATLPDEGIEHILKLSPAVRIVLSLRDPIERSWSHMRMTTGIDADVADLERAARNRDLTERADYPAIVARWRSLIPEERFLTIFMDDIAVRPQRVLAEMCGFLGVEHRAEYFAKANNPIHVGEKREMPASVHAVLKERFRPVYEWMAARYPEVGKRWMERQYGA